MSICCHDHPMASPVPPPAFRDLPAELNKHMHDWGGVESTALILSHDNAKRCLMPTDAKDRVPMDANRPTPANIGQPRLQTTSQHWPKPAKTSQHRPKNQPKPTKTNQKLQKNKKESKKTRNSITPSLFFVGTIFLCKHPQVSTGTSAVLRLSHCPIMYLCFGRTH